MSIPDGGPTEDGVDRFQKGFDEWQEVIEQVVDDVDLETFFRIMADIQELSPEERFTKSRSRFQVAFLDAAGEENVNEVVTQGESSPVSREMFETLDGVWSLLQKAMLKHLEHSREDESLHLLFALYLEKVQNAFGVFNGAIEDSESINRPGSTLIALSSRLLEVIFDVHEVDEEEMFRDVLRADYYLEKSGSPLIQSPKELRGEKVHKEILIEAAVLAYERLDISVGRGAELAGVSFPEFQEALDRHGIRPNGPKDLNEVVSESSLYESKPDW
jgi:predicted HTH domain antitoxin